MADVTVESLMTFNVVSCKRLSREAEEGGFEKFHWL